MTTTRPRHHHLADAASCAGELRKLSKDVTGLNRKTAIFVPAVLGSMPFFWFANILALCSLPAILTAFDSEVLKHAIGFSSFFPSVIIKVSLIALVAWLAQTYIQLVALPVLQVSNNAQMLQQEHNTSIMLKDGEETRVHTEKILEELNLETEGGLKTILAAIEALEKRKPGGFTGKAVE